MRARQTARKCVFATVLASFGQSRVSQNARLLLLTGIKWDENFLVPIIIIEVTKKSNLWLDNASIMITGTKNPQLLFKNPHLHARLSEILYSEFWPCWLKLHQRYQSPARFQCLCVFLVHVSLKSAQKFQSSSTLGDMRARQTARKSVFAPISATPTETTPNIWVTHPFPVSVRVPHTCIFEISPENPV